VVPNGVPLATALPIWDVAPSTALEIAYPLGKTVTESKRIAPAKPGGESFPLIDGIYRSTAPANAVGAAWLIRQSRTSAENGTRIDRMPSSGKCGSPFF
jgi:hypothetical protein